MGQIEHDKIVTLGQYWEALSEYEELLSAEPNRETGRRIVELSAMLEEYEGPARDIIKSKAVDTGDNPR